MWALLVWSVIAALVQGIEFYDDSNEHIKMLKQKLKALESKEEFAIDDYTDELDEHSKPVKVKEDPEVKTVCLLSFGREYCVTVQKQEERGRMEIKGKLELVECILKNIAVGWRSAATLCWDARTRRDYPRSFLLKPLSETIASVE